MNFLAGNALWLLLLGIVILVIYILRMPRRRHIASSILILLGMDKFTRRERRRLRTIISFAIIFTAFTAIVFDAARPFYSNRKADNRDHILLLDLSCSMKATTVAPGSGATGGTRFERAIRSARALVNSLPVGDRVMLITLADSAQILRNFESHRPHLITALDKARPLDTGTNWKDAARLLQEVLPGSQNPVIHLFTDGAGFASADWDSLPRKCEWRFHPADTLDQEAAASSDYHNIGITNFRARTTFNSDRDFQVIAEIRNFSDKKREVEADLYPDEDLIHTWSVELEPGEVSSQVFKKELKVGGVLYVRLMQPKKGPDEADRPYEDALAVDNVAQDVIPSPTRPNVLIFSEPGMPKGFIEDAFSANTNVFAYRQPINGYSPNWGADIFVFYDIPAEKLPETLPPNKDILFINTNGKSMPAKVQKEFEKNPMMRLWNRHHPLMNYLTLSNLLLAEAQVFGVPGWAQALAETTSGPFIVAGETPQRQLVFIGFDPRKSDISFRVDFPILLANAVLWMKERAPDPEPVRPGETFLVKITDKEARTLEIIDPTGKTTQLDIGEERVVPIVATRHVGVYSFKAGTQRGAFSVNLNDAEESDVSAPPELQIGGAVIKPFHEEEQARIWRFWPALAVLALGILVVENSLYHRRILF